jgi:hypothetical protein
MFREKKKEEKKISSTFVNTGTKKLEFNPAIEEDELSLISYFII